MSEEPPVKYRIKAKDQPGPQSMWIINRPDIGMVGNGYRFIVLSQHVQDWRRANGWPIGLDFEQELENALCQEYPDYCESDDPRAPINPKGRRVSLGDIIGGTRVWLKQALSGRQVVSAEEANARANVCLNCPMKVPFPGGCGGHCGELVDWMKDLTGSGKFKLAQEDALNQQACFICNCFLQAAAWVPVDVQISVLSEHQKIQFKQMLPNCWKAKAIWGTS